MIDNQDSNGYTLLSLAVHYGRVEIVDLLLKNGADPNIASFKEKNTPLHIAVNFRFRKICDLLIDAGADESLLNSDGLVPWEGIVLKK
jgi:ankyrin repeat protein